MKYLITGGCGFIGTNLAMNLINSRHDLIILDNMSRSGSAKNLENLKKKGDFVFYPMDIRNYNDFEFVFLKEKPDVIFHLAGQVAMTTSVLNPRLDFETNVIGTINVLECIRKFKSETIVVYSSSNKVYGDFAGLTFIETETRYKCKEYPTGINELYPLDFHSPYGCSKGAADQYLLDYHRMYGIRSVVLRHSSMYGGHQNSTIDQGWVTWFIRQAELQKEGFNDSFTVSGNGKQVRDVLHSDDVVRLYLMVVDNINDIAGEVFNIGGGIDNSLSLLELFDFLQRKLHVELRIKRLPFRESDQLVFVADNSKIMSKLPWKPKITYEEGIMRIINS